MQLLRKKGLALLCALTLMLGLVPMASALTGDATRAADALNTLGIIQGTRAGYAEDRPANRAEAAVILVRLAGAEAAAKTAPKGTFTDLPAWAAPAIRYAFAQGWVSGRTGQTYVPGDTVSAADWCTMVLRLLGYSDAKGDFSHGGAVQFAQHLGLITTAYTDFTRGDLFQVALSALTLPKKDGGTLLADLVEKGLVTADTVKKLGLDEGATLTARQIADRYTAAVFTMDCYAKQEEVTAGKPAGQASGFFITADGLAVTNYHSIAGAIAANATLITGEKYKVERVLYYDPDIDVAVIQVAMTSTAGVKTPTFAHMNLVSRDTVHNGDVVYTLGSPLGLGLCISSGIVASRTKEVETYALPMIQNTADISVGSSGGALLNEKGQVVGITSGAYVYGNNMYLAVPIDPVLKADLTGKGWTLQEVASKEAARIAATKKA